MQRPQGLDHIPDDHIFLDHLSASFTRDFGARPKIVAYAPGRVNLIGEHTDYNGGLVLPMAIDRKVTMVAGPRDDHVVVASSEDYGEQLSFSLATRPSPPLHPRWIDYFHAVATAMSDDGFAVRGANVSFTGDIPIGAGLSSSAALELASGLCFQAIGNFALLPLQLAQICQRAERDYIGVQCGIMDQFVIAHGRAGHAILLDCSDLSYRYVQLPAEISVVVTDSGLRRNLAASAYNERTAQCAAALRLLASRRRGLRSLSEVALDDLSELAVDLPEVLRKRVRHVASENARVAGVAEALERGDLAKAGALMGSSHESLRDDYEVSLPELDLLVEIALSAGALGARLTGAGFGGCIVSLVPKEHAEAFARAVDEAYLARSSRSAHSHICTASNRAKVMPIHV